MTKLEEFFRPQTDSLPDPRVRNWQARLQQPGTTATLEVYRPEIEFGQSQPDMNLQFIENGKLLPLETFPWDDDLNAGLIELEVRATNPDQEAERFALGLRAAMRKANRNFGDGYFNAVLLEFLQDSDLKQYREITEVLQHTVAIRPSDQSRGYNTCREMIADAISGRARELTDFLHYPSEEAKSILIKALARYLDERFSVSNRRRLGLL